MINQDNPLCTTCGERHDLNNKEECIDVLLGKISILRETLEGFEIENEKLSEKINASSTT